MTDETEKWKNSALYHEKMSEKYLEALVEMCEQFAFPCLHGGMDAYTTGGLFVLEKAFDAIGWDDPQIDSWEKSNRKTGDVVDWNGAKVILQRYHDMTGAEKKGIFYNRFETFEIGDEIVFQNGVRAKITFVPPQEG